MTIITPNFTQALDQVCPGIYDVEIVGCDHYLSKGNTNCLKWKLKIISGPFHNRPLTYTTPIEGKGAGYLRQLIQTIDPGYIEGDLNIERYLNKRISIKAVNTETSLDKRSYLNLIPLNPDEVETERLKLSNVLAPSNLEKATPGVDNG